MKNTKKKRKVTKQKRKVTIKKRKVTIKKERKKKKKLHGGGSSSSTMPNASNTHIVNTYGTLIPEYKSSDSDFYKTDLTKIKKSNELSLTDNISIMLSNNINKFKDKENANIFDEYKESINLLIEKDDKDLNLSVDVRRIKTLRNILQELKQLSVDYIYHTDCIRHMNDKYNTWSPRVRENNYLETDIIHSFINIAYVYDSIYSKNENAECDINTDYLIEYINGLYDIIMNENVDTKKFHNCLKIVRNTINTIMNEYELTN